MSEPLEIEGRDLQRQSYLRSNQVEELELERSRLIEQITTPQSHLRTQDAMTTKRRIIKLGQQLEEQIPPELKGELLDRVARREKELREQILEGMPSQAEMRRGPSGSLGKHQSWQKRNSMRMVEWKNCALLLSRSGYGDYADPDVANFERFRPVVSSLNLDDPRVPAKTFVGTHPSSDYREGWDRTFGDPEERIAKLQEEIELLRKLNAEQEAQADEPRSRRRTRAEVESGSAQE